MTKKRSKQSTAEQPRLNRWTPAVVAVVLVLLCALTFGGALRHEFVNYDDPDYVYQNPRVSSGLTLENVKWAFTSPHARNWHPLTTLTHMLDVELWGLNAGGHHFVSVLLHAATAVMLFLVLRAMTGSLWRSAFVAAVFAVHPLRVESVAWVSERKDVLSGLFFVLTLAAYLHYTRQRTAGRYVLVLLALAAGLISKPMLVTLPFLLLLLDVWPLRRSPALLEKLPMIALAAGAAITTLLIQTTGGAMRDPLPLMWRINNAVVSYVTYMADTLWPVKLAPFYPHPENQLPLWHVALASLLLTGITAVAVLLWRRKPFVATGWFWYLGMLVPVVGLVEVGAHSHADRYTYLPQIGLLIAATWAIKPHKRWAVPAVAVVLALALAAWKQTSYWRDSASLWTRALAVTERNHVAHNNLGELALQRGEVSAALQHFDEAISFRSASYIKSHDFLLALYHHNRAAVLQRLRRLQEAITGFERAVILQPDYMPARVSYAGAILAAGDAAKARARFLEVLEQEPRHAEARAGLALTLLEMGLEVEAAEQYEKVLQVEPLHGAALNNLMWLYSASSNRALRNPERAIQLANEAVAKLGDGDPMLLHKVAAARAAAGDFAAAIQTAERALQLAEAQGETALAHELQRNLAKYRAGTPLP